MSTLNARFDTDFYDFRTPTRFRAEIQNGNQSTQELSCFHPGSHSIELNDEIQISLDALKKYIEKHKVKIVNNCVDPSSINQLALIQLKNMYPVAMMSRCLEWKTISDGNLSKDAVDYIMENY